MRRFVITVLHQTLFKTLIRELKICNMYYTLRSKNAYQILDRDVPKMEVGVGVEGAHSEMTVDII